MGGRLVAALVALALQAAADGRFRIGLVDMRPSQPCLALTGAPLAKGSPIVIVTPGEPQQIVRATIVDQVAGCDAMAKSDLPGPYYQVKTERALDELMGLGIAVAGTHQARIASGRARLALNARYPGVRFRSCASSEGLHLTVWAGEPLVSERLWHAYWYLGYDVEPDCRPEDYR